MAVTQFSKRLRKARAEQIEVGVTGGSEGFLRIYAGTIPTVAPADTGDLPVDSIQLFHFDLPANFAITDSNADTTKVGTWTGLGESGLPNAINATYFIMWDADFGVGYVLGDVTATGGGGTMQLDNVSISANQPVTVTAFSIPEGNA